RRRALRRDLLPVRTRTRRAAMVHVGTGAGLAALPGAGGGLTTRGQGGMKGVILAAGRGARLNGGNGDMPKCLVTVGGETLLARNVRVLREAGIDDVVVVVGCAADTVRRSVPDVTF